MNDLLTVLTGLLIYEVVIKFISIKVETYVLTKKYAAFQNKLQKEILQAREANAKELELNKKLLQEDYENFKRKKGEID